MAPALPTATRWLSAMPLRYRRTRVKVPAPSRPARSPPAPLLSQRSAEEPVDVVGADAVGLVVVTAQRDVVEHVEGAVGLAVLVQPDQRPGDVEGHPHRLGGLVRAQRRRPPP